MILDVFNVIQNVALDWDFGRVFLKLVSFVVYLYSAAGRQTLLSASGFQIKCNF